MSDEKSQKNCSTYEIEFWYYSLGCQNTFHGVLSISNSHFLRPDYECNHERCTMYFKFHKTWISNCIKFMTSLPKISRLNYVLILVQIKCALHIQIDKQLYQT